MNLTPIPPEQEAIEREVIAMMMNALKCLQDYGYNDFQTLTSFIANLLCNQPNPHKDLKHLTDMVKTKLNIMRQMRTKH